MPGSGSQGRCDRTDRPAAEPATRTDGRDLRTQRGGEELKAPRREPCRAPRPTGAPGGGLDELGAGRPPTPAVTVEPAPRAEDAAGARAARVGVCWLLLQFQHVV